MLEKRAQRGVWRGSEIVSVSERKMACRPQRHEGEEVDKGKME